MTGSSRFEVALLRELGHISDALEDLVRLVRRLVPAIDVTTECQAVDPTTEEEPNHVPE